MPKEFDYIEESIKATESLAEQKHTKQSLLDAMQLAAAELIDARRFMDQIYDRGDFSQLPDASREWRICLCKCQAVYDAIIAYK